MTTKIRIGGRGFGKTHQLIEWMKCNEPHETRIMICYSEQEVKRLQNENRFIEGWRFVNFHNLESLRGRGRVTLCIDNMDLIMNKIFLGMIVDRITATDWMIL